MMQSWKAGLIILTASVTTCHAQETLFRNFGPPMGGFVTNQRGGTSDRPSLRVQVSIQVQMPGTRDMSLPDQAAAISTGHGALYDLMRHECDLISKNFEGECRLSNINLGNQPQNYGPTSAMSFSANATFEVVPRASASEVPPKP